MDHSEYADRLDVWAEAHRQEMTDDISALVRIDSTKGEAKEGKPFGEGPAAALTAMARLAESKGFQVHNYDNYCMTADLAGEGEKSLDILAHLDVVPVSKDWKKTQPFEPLQEDHYLYGRGTADDKGPAIAAFYAMRAVSELGIGLRHGVRLILGADEECGSSDLEHYYGIEKEAEYTFSPDANFPLINIEKARLAKKFTADLPEDYHIPCVLEIDAGSKANVVPGTADAAFRGLTKEQLEQAARETEKKTKAAVTWELKSDREFVHVKGQTGHAAMPDNGSVNALTALLFFISRLPLAGTKTTHALLGLAELFPFGDCHGKALGVDLCDEESGELTLSLDILKLQNGKLTAEFDCRAPLCATEENLTEKIRVMLRQKGFEMEDGPMTPAHYVPADSPFVKTLLQSYERYFGKPGKPMAIGGGTYVHGLKRGVAFGCEVEGVDNRMHGDDEFVDIDVLVKSVKIFADALIQLCG